MRKVELSNETVGRSVRFAGKVHGELAVIPVLTQHTQYGGTYLYEPKLVVVKNTWLERLCRLFAARSKVEPLADGFVRHFGSAIELLQTPPRLEAAWAGDAASLEPAEVHDLFESLESRLRASTFTELQQSSISVAFRSACVKNLVALGARRVSKSSVRFRSKLQQRPAPRKLISDFATAEFPPVGATPHENIRELEAKMLARLNDDLGNIRQAALAELEAGQRLPVDPQGKQCHLLFGRRAHGADLLVLQ